LFLLINLLVESKKQKLGYNQKYMRVIRPKILGTLQIKLMMAGNYAVVNGIKNPPNKLIIPCNSYEHGFEIIERLKEVAVGEVIYT
jgi:hypothetical protein